MQNLREPEAILIHDSDEVRQMGHRTDQNTTKWSRTRHPAVIVVAILVATAALLLFGTFLPSQPCGPTRMFPAWVLGLPVALVASGVAALVIGVTSSGLKGLTATIVLVAAVSIAGTAAAVGPALDGCAGDVAFVLMGIASLSGAVVGYVVGSVWRWARRRWST